MVQVCGREVERFEDICRQKQKRTRVNKRETATSLPLGTISIFQQTQDNIDAADICLKFDRLFCLDGTVARKVGQLASEILRSSLHTIRGSFFNWNISVKRLIPQHND